MKHIGDKAPYYDDYDKTKNYTRVMFKPSLAVQARELTQSQTMLQNQISSLSDYSFKDGTNVSGASISYSYNQPKMKIKPFDNTGNAISNDKLVGRVFVGQESGQYIKVTDYVDDTQWITFTYYGGPVTNGEVFKEPADGIVTFTMEENSVGSAVVAACTEGTLYVDGFFVTVPKSNIIVDIENNDEEYNIGFKIERQFVTSKTDGTLNDPASGTTNYNAPGADRYQVQPSLASYKTTDNVTDEYLKSFIPGIVVKDNELIKGQDSGINADLIDALAKRTYDESGSYTVNPWKVQLKEHTDADKYIVSVQPGSGYIHGYEVSNLRSENITVEKPRTFIEKPDNVQYVQGGVYTQLLIDGATDVVSGKGMPNFRALDRIEVMSELNGAGTVLGECAITDIVRDSEKILVYLTDIAAVANIFSGAKSLRSKANPVSVYANLYIDVNGNAVLTGTDSVRIVATPYNMVKSVNAGSIDYEVSKVYNVTSAASGNTITITDPNINIDLPNKDGLVIITETDTDNFVDITDISVQTLDNSGSVSYLVLHGDSIANGVNYSVMLRTHRKNMEIRTKTARKATQTISVADGIDKVMLEHEDIVYVKSIKQTSNKATTVPDNLISEVVVDNGQTDYLYELGSITGFNTTLAKYKLTDTNATSYEIEYFYYEHTGDGPFVADSYINTNNAALLSDFADLYVHIPVYKTYKLRDCMDFRVKRSTLTLATPTKFPVYGTEVSYVSNVYLPRIDTIWVDKNGTFGVAKGIPSENPVVPEKLDNTLVLYVVYNNAYVPDLTAVKLNYINNQRYTMKDIGVIESRVTNVEDVVSFTQLEQNAINMQILDENGMNRYKSGIFTDAFTDFTNSDYVNKEYDGTIDEVEQSFRCDFDVKNVAFKYDEDSINVHKKDVCATLPYTTYEYAKNPYASETMNVQELLFYRWNGNVKLVPSIDTWVNDLGDFVVNVEYIETPPPPATFRSWTTVHDTGRRGDVTRHTTTHTSGQHVYSAGYTVRDTAEEFESQDEFMRERNVAFECNGFRPGMQLEAYMDDTKLDLSNTLVDIDGKLTGLFKVPAKMPVGTKQVTFSDAADTTSGSASYVAHGKTIWRNIERDYIRAWQVVPFSTSSTVSRYIDPIAQSFYVAENTGVYLDSIDVFFKTKDENISVELYIVENETGLPSTRMVPFAKSTLEANDVVTGISTPCKFKFDNPIYLQPFVEYSFIVYSASHEYEIYTSTLGAADILTGVGIAEQPYLGTLYKSQNANTWTPEQMSDIKFTIHCCHFDTNVTGIAKFDIEKLDEPFDVAVSTLVANTFLPIDTVAKYKYKWNNQSLYTEFTNAEEVFEQTLKTLKDTTDIAVSLKLQVEISTTNENVSPMIDTEQVYGIFSNNKVKERKNDSTFTYNAGSYISNIVRLKNPADDIRIFIDAIKPGYSDIDVYYKTVDYKPVYATQATTGLCSNTKDVSALVGVSSQLFYYNKTDKRLEPQTPIVVSGSKDGKIYIRAISDPDKLKNVNPGNTGQLSYLGLDAKYSHILILPLTVSTDIDLDDWSSLKTYVVNDMVIYRDTIWRARTNVLANQKPSDLSVLWERMHGAKTISSVLFDDSVEYRKMVKTEAINNSNTEFIEYQYKPELEAESNFNAFVIRVDLKSNDKVNIPRIKNLRAIAVL